MSPQPRKRETGEPTSNVGEFGSKPEPGQGPRLVPTLNARRSELATTITQFSAGRPNSQLQDEDDASDIFMTFDYLRFGDDLQMLEGSYAEIRGPIDIDERHLHEGSEIANKIQILADKLEKLAAGRDPGRAILERDAKRILMRMPILMSPSENLRVRAEYGNAPEELFVGSTEKLGKLTSVISRELPTAAEVELEFGGYRTEVTAIRDNNGIVIWNDEDEVPDTVRLIEVFRSAASEINPDVAFTMLQQPGDGTSWYGFRI